MSVISDTKAAAIRGNYYYVINRNVICTYISTKAIFKKSDIIFFLCALIFIRVVHKNEYKIKTEFVQLEEREIK